MKKSILYSFLVLFVIACGGGDDNGPGPIDDDGPMGIENDGPTGSDGDNGTSSDDKIVLDLNGVDTIDFSDVTVISISEQKTISQDGVFEEPQIDTQEESLPILLLENEAILAGYYPQNVANQKVTLDDILFYFFKSYYRIQISGIADELLMSEIKSLDSYENLIEILISSLNENISPITNQLFIESIQSFATDSITNTSKTSGITNKVVEDFFFEYGRDGRLSWSSDKVPLFANVGFAVRNKGTNQIVFGPELLETKSLDLNASTIVKFLQEQFGEPFPPFSESFQFQENGEYEIVLTNGSSLVDNLNQAVLIRDINDVATLAFTAVFSAGVQNLAGSGDLCKSAMASLFNENFNFFLNHIVQGTEPSLDEIKTQLLASGTQFLSSVVDCGLSSVALIWISAKIGAALSIFNIAFDIFEISSIIRDSPIGLDLNAEETRFFNNGVSFGELKITDESEKEFSGLVADDFQYSKTIKEEVTIYEIDRGVFSSTFTAEVFEDEGAKDLPFKYEIVSGDALVVNGPIFKTEFDGTLNFNMTMGSENSEILLSPDFETSVIESTTINLEKKEENTEVDLTGRWHFNFDSDGLSGGTCTTYNQDGSLNNILPGGNMGFYNSIVIDEDGTLIDNSFNGFYDSSYTITESTLNFIAVHDMTNQYDYITFTGVWDDSKEAFVGTATRETKEWWGFGDERNQISVECSGFSEYAEVSKSSYILP